MQIQEERGITFIAQLFETFVVIKSKPIPLPIAQFESHQQVKVSFYQNFFEILSICKLSIKNICLNAHKIQQSVARKIVNTLMYLSKDVNNLLDDGILNLYMDLVEMKQQLMYEEQLQQDIRFVESCIGLFFVFCEYKKAQRGKGVKLTKSISLLKQFSAQSQEETQVNVKAKLNCKQPLCQQDVAQIRLSIHSFTINQLLKQFLNEYQTQLNNLEQTCKICSKNIKLHHLQQHVVYCQKKYIIKQDLNFFQKKIVAIANDLIAKIKHLDISQVCHINSGPLTVIQDIDVIGNAEYAELLDDVVNVHRIGSFKNNLKKIHSQNKIKQHLDKYQNLICRFQTFIESYQENQQRVQNINHFLTLQRQILNLAIELRTVQLQYQNLKEIVSSSTIRPLSSTNKMSEKKSRFACNKFQQIALKNRPSHDNQCSSKPCFDTIVQPDSNSNDEKKQNEQKHDNLQSDENLDQDNLSIVALNTKQSLGNCRIVHFHVEKSEDEHNSQTKIEESRIKKGRIIKSMVMFQDSDDSDSDCRIQHNQQEENQNSCNQDEENQNSQDDENQDLQHEENQSQQHEENQDSQKSSRPQKTVRIKDFQILKLLGKGAFGKVYAVRKKKTSDLYALKIIDIDENWGPQQFQQIRNEHQIFKKVAGEHLVQAPYCFSDGSVHVFVMEFMPGGDLSKVLQEEVYLEEDRAKYVIAEIVLAIEHLHRADIIHRDLKPENLVIDQRGHLKLTDFGLSQIKLQNKIQKITSINKNKQQQAKRRRIRRTGMVAAKSKAKIIGTPDYIAPQIINSLSINNRSIDWWSLGVISYEILIGVRPFCGNTIEEVLDNILKFAVEWPQIGQEQGMISQQAYDFIQRLLSKDFVNRLGAQDVQEIKNHPFFQGVNWDKLKHQQAHITPNYAKIKQLLEMRQNEQLRAQIEQKTQKTPNRQTKMPQLDNFIRFDILGQKTVKQANKVMSKKTGTLKRLRSIKNIMTEKENDCGYLQAKIGKNTWIARSEKGLDKEKGSRVQISMVDEDI